MEDAALSSPANAKRVQQRLVDLGYLSGEPDGIWGPHSQAGLKVFRSKAGLGDDGIWDSATEKILFSSSAPKNRREGKTGPSERGPFGGLFRFGN